MEKKNKGYKFTKGNRFYLHRKKSGRDKIFNKPELLLEAFDAYREWNKENVWNKIEVKTRIIELVKGEQEEKRSSTVAPMTITAFCHFVGVNENYMRNFRSEQKDEPDFTAVIQYIYEQCESQMFAGASVGAYNANIISRKLGLADKIHQESVNYNTNITKDEAEAIAAALDKRI